MKRNFTLVVAVLIVCVFSNAHAVGLTVRFGGGLLFDDRAEDGVLGGGQLAADVRLAKIPLAFQLAGEYWSKGSLEHPYEIESYEVFNVLLFGHIGRVMSCLFTKPVVRTSDYVYLGGGAGRISVPKIDDPDERERGIAYDAVCGANVGIFWKLGLFAEGKYIYCSKTTDNVEVIDFSDLGFLLGVSLNFDL